MSVGGAAFALPFPLALLTRLFAFVLDFCLLVVIYYDDRPRSPSFQDILDPRSIFPLDLFLLELSFG